MNDTCKGSYSANETFSRLPITDLEDVSEQRVRLFKPGILVEGCSHQLVAPYDSGKTFLALIAGNAFLDEGLKVMYLDYENRASSIKSRLKLIGTDRSVRNDLIYVNNPDLDLSEDSKRQWTAFLELHRPNLIVFDSQNGFLSSAGSDENSSTQFQSWANTYLKIPRALGISTLVIDHTGWEGNHSRGTSRKPDEFDIVWKVSKVSKFSRSSAGQLELKLIKDRDSLIENGSINCVIGGDPFQFRVEPTNSTESGFSNDQESTFDLIDRNSKDGIGTPRKSVNELFNGSKSRADKAIKFLVQEDLIYQPEGSKLYWTVDSKQDSSDSSPVEPNQDPGPDSSVEETNGEGVSGSRSFRTGPQDPAPRTGGSSDGLEEEPIERGFGHDVKADRIASGESEHASDAAISTQDVMEEIENLDFNPRGIEVLKVVALIYLDNPIMTTSRPSYFADKDRNRMIKLAKEKGDTIDDGDITKASRVLKNNQVFVAAIRKRVKQLFDPSYNPYYEESTESWDDEYEN